MAKRFVSKYRALRVWVKQPTTKVVDGQVVNEPGKSVEFVNGVYETNDKAEMEAIRKYGGDAVVEVDIKDEPQKVAQTVFPDTQANVERIKQEAQDASEEGETIEQVVDSGDAEDGYENLTIPQLKEVAAKYGIQVKRGMKKDEIIALIEEAEANDEEDTPQF